MKYVICTCSKNEEKYLDEWVEHHMKIGFDTFIIYDNNDDPRQLNRFLSARPYRKHVIVNPINGKSNMQRASFRDAYYRYNFEWCAFLDGDEFIELAQHNTIQEYLSMFPPDCYAVGLNWMCYGNCGHKNAPPKDLERWDVKPRFKHPKVPTANKDTINTHIKTIMRKVRVPNNEWDFPTPHFMTCPLQNCYINNGEKLDQRRVRLEERSFSEPVNYDYAYLAHYLVKSDEEFDSRSSNRKVDDVKQEQKRKNRELARQNTFDQIDENLLYHMNVGAIRGIDSVDSIIIKSDDQNTVFSCLKPGKRILLVGQDKRGKILTDYIDAAHANRVKEIKWKFSIGPEIEREYDAIVE